ETSSARRPTPRRPQQRPRAETARTAEERTTSLIERYEIILQQRPEDAFAWRRLTELVRERDGSLEPLAERLEGRARQSDDYPAHFLLGRLREAQARPDRAAESYRRAATLRPDEPGPWLALAQLHRSTGSLDEARAALRQALERTRDRQARRELLRQLAEWMLDAGDFEQAESLFETLARDGGSYDGTGLARALAERGQHERAIEAWRRAIGAAAGDRRALAPLLRELAASQLAAGHAQQAIATLERALSIGGTGSGHARQILDTLVDAHRAADRLPELVERLERGAFGRAGQAWLGRLYEELGRDEQAIAAYRALLRASPRDTETRLRLIQLLARSGRVEQLLEEQRALVRADPGDGRRLVELASLLAQTGRRAEALALVDRVARAPQSRPAVLRAVAELLGRWGESERATAVLHRLARVDPSDPSHLVALGSERLAAGDRDGALALWRQIPERVTDRAEGHAILGRTLADHDLLAEAAIELERAVRMRPDALEHVRAYANVLERSRRDDEALVQWHRVLELAGSDRGARREARQRIVSLWARTGRLAAEVQARRGSLDASPPDLEAARFVAEALRREPSRAAEAEAWLARLVERAPGDVESLLALERLRTARGDLAGALQVLERLVEADARAAASHLGRMADLALSLYRDEDAVRYANAAVERAPQDASAHRRLGDLYRARNDLDRAVVSYRRALDLDDRLFETHLVLAELLVGRGQHAEARRLFAHVVRSSPDDELVARAARSAIQLSLATGESDSVESLLLPLALGHPGRPLYRRLLVEWLDTRAAALTAASRDGHPDAGEAARTLASMTRRSVKPLLDALADDDPAQRRVAIELLRWVAEPVATNALLSLAEDTSAPVELRIRALSSAAEAAAPEHAARLAVLSTATERRLRVPAARGLARLGAPRAVPFLVPLLTRGDPEVRAWAALGLSSSALEQTADLLVHVMRADRASVVQAAAALALGWRGSTSHLDDLVAALRSRSGLPAAAAATALGMHAASSATPHRRADVVEALTTASFDADPVVKHASRRALHATLAATPLRVGSPFAADPGASILATLSELILGAGETGLPVPGDLEPHLPSLVAGARAALLAPTEVLLDGLESLARGEPLTSFGVSVEWVRPWLRQLAPALQSLTRDHGDPAVRAAALGPLAAAGDEEALASALDDTDPRVVRHALSLLAASPPAAATVQRVARLASASDWSIRERAIRALGASDAPEATTTLVRTLLTDPSALVRQAAAERLRGRTEARSALETAAQHDPEPAVRRAASEALAGS
ncbi:MAG: HEAT repeat domain-containing protein, partial [Myxococcota bacterium]|nr:HEAT repeat domain-containing protein [Myxococcota bacterium]